MRTLVIARHGQTVHNAARRLQGQTDSPLTAAGREQARVLGGRLTPLLVPDVRVVTSDIGRALTTAEIALPDVARSTDVRLREMHFGRFEGLDHEECIEKHGDVYTGWVANRLTAPTPDGESFPQLTARVLEWLDEQPDERTTIAVTHGGPGIVLVSHLLGIPFDAAWRAGFEHGAAIRFTITGDGADAVWLSDEALHGPEASRQRLARALEGEA